MWQGKLPTGVAPDTQGMWLQVSTGMLAPMTKLKGTDHDRPDNVLKELLIMQVQASPTLPPHPHTHTCYVSSLRVMHVVRSTS